MEFAINGLPTLWYENRDGERWLPPDDAAAPVSPPEGFCYQWSRFPRQLHETVLKIEDGKSHKIMEGASGWPGDLVLALTRPTWWERSRAIARYGSPGPVLTLEQAILWAAGCEHCINTLAHRVGLGWGYRAGSEQDNSRTSCERCRSVHEAPPAIARSG